ncbi:MAG TPA: carboxylating nicotinate-nucleotide diphosphorylase [Segeticoccus sp.]|uniref:carboxylating nicotinate-nucleotide diphosphorylase n=1 Tax=Segeticoccus sp. TaxID=2706531 RepID=UPI002D80FD50|nr:carboxylating nicotinate-nucleotide diphosphorylase [Segeticoccus sp.]HET8599579.1 carboxylating nicotinate-nucleotide diphosphorylase [Segeticoccus sp.]
MTDTLITRPQTGPAPTTVPSDVPPLVRTALAEDLAAAGDLTTTATVPADACGTAYLVARGEGVLSGTAFLTQTYAELDPAVQVTLQRADGAPLAAGDHVARLQGPARSILTGERVALNFVGHLSGVATATRRMADLVAHTRARVCDTRKTTPGLRAAEKRAVVDGGGVNHRFGLYDAILVKDNHLGLAGGLEAVLDRLARRAGHLVRVEVEVDTLEQLRTVLATDAARLAAGAAPVVHAVLLDNLGPEVLAAAVALVRTHPAPVLIEASGGITAATATAVAEAGVDLISSGALTHSAPSLDVALDLT